MLGLSISDKHSGKVSLFRWSSVRAFMLIEVLFLPLCLYSPSSVNELLYRYNSLSSIHLRIYSRKLTNNRLKLDYEYLSHQNPKYNPEKDNYIFNYILLYLLHIDSDSLMVI